MKHDVLRRNIQKKTDEDILDEMSLSTVEHWLSDKLGLESAIIRQVRVNHKKVFTKPTDPAETQVDKNVSPNRIFISEQEAVERIKDLQINLLTLRKYARKKGLLQGDLSRSFRYGKDFKYREDFIEDLSKNWVSREYFCQKKRLSLRMFYRLQEKESWRTLKLGRTLLVNRNDGI